MHATFETIDVVVLAGGINRVRLFEGYECGYKALVPLRGRPVISYTLDALRQVKQVKRVCIVGPQAELQQTLGDSACDYAFVPGGETILSSITAGLQYFSDESLILLMLGDAPLTCAPTITEFLHDCQNLESKYVDNIWLPAVAREHFQGAYRSVRKPFNRYRGLTTGYGNFAIVTPSLAHHCLLTAAINPIYNARKSPLSLAAVGGRVSFIYLTYVVGAHLLRLLTQEQIFRLMSRCFQLGVIPVEASDPGIVIDMDDPADYAFIQKQMEVYAD